MLVIATYPSSGSYSGVNWTLPLTNLTMAGLYQLPITCTS
jgi:hypothetical protein